MRSIYTSENPQRLDAENLEHAYIVGLFEGDGYFSVNKKGKYLTYEIGIELSINDRQLIYNIKNLLGVGVIYFREKREMVALRIRNKEHLKKYIVPIFDKYPMFSNKQYDYLRFRNALFSNVIYHIELPKYIRSNIHLNTVDFIINASYFSAWLVGFIEAEGCFSVYNLKNNNDYPVGSFDIAQTEGEILIQAIRNYLLFTTIVYKDKTNCYKLKVTGVKSINNIINFLDKAPVKLKGNKKLQYIIWINKLREIPRYNKNINLPSNY